MSSFQPIICVPMRTHRVFFAELTEFAPRLSEFSSPKQYSRNSIPPVSKKHLEKQPIERGSLRCSWSECDLKLGSNKCSPKRQSLGWAIMSCYKELLRWAKSRDPNRESLAI